MAWGDYDNDGYLDVVVTGNAPGSNGITVLYHNNGDGTFSPMPFRFEGYRSGSVQWGDFDNDGFLDLLVSGLGNDGLTRIYHNLGGTNFVEFMQFGLQYDGKVDWGDFNNDGKLDFAMSGAGSYNQVYQNLGGTNFSLLTNGMVQVYYGSVAWADYDRDGRLDLLVTGMGGFGSTGSYVYHNDGGGQFSLVWSSTPFEPGHWLDIDNDGWPDLVIGDWPIQVTHVYRNNQAGGFDQIALLPIGPLAVGDFNNDGWSDVLVNNQVLQNSGVGTFTIVQTSLPDLGTSTLANNAFCGDFDNDGRLDLILSDSTSTTYLYRNVTEATNAPPTAPDALQAVASRTNVVFNWNSATDDHQTNGLTYNFRVGTAPGGFDIISPMSAPNGFRRVARPGNAGSLTHYILSGLKPATRYYWSVQAVDNSFAGSPFASEHSFVATVLPTISGFSDQSVVEDSGPLVLSFSVSDFETPADALVVDALSSNPQLVGPTNLTFSGTGTHRVLTVTLQSGQVGTASINVTVTDQDGGQSAQEFILTVVPRNHPPVPRIAVSPLVDLPGLTVLTAMTPVCRPATLMLDASQSTDQDGDPLQYTWTENANPTPFAKGQHATARFYPGNYIITLSVSDGKSTNHDSIQLDVITPAAAVKSLEALLPASNLPRGTRQEMLASLRAAESSFTECHPVPGINQLEAFRVKVSKNLGRRDPPLAALLMHAVDEITASLADPQFPQKPGKGPRRPLLN